MRTKLTAVLLILTLILAVIPAAEASGEDSGLFLTALGDSITTGYGLPGGRYGSASYINLASAELELMRDNYVNFAVNGYTSADLLALIPACAEDIRRADILVFEIGYNDILGYMYSAMCLAAGDASLYMDELKAAVSCMDSAAAEACADALLSEASGPLFRALYENFEANLQSIVSLLREYNPEARVYMQSLYNPLAGLGFFREFSEAVVGGMNTVLARTAQTYGFGYLDVHAAFLGHETEYTRIDSYDIHPNEAGHLAIFELLCDALTEDGFLPGEAETTAEAETVTVTETPEETEAEEKTSANPLPAVCAVLTAGAGICGLYYCRKKRKK